MDDLRTLIRTYEQDTPDATADAVFDAVGCPQKWRDLFGPVVRDECRRLYRGAVRSAESHPDGHTCGDTQAATAVGVTTRTDYLAQRFATGDGRYVTWAEATVDDHRSRIAMLATLRNGIDATIERHVDAIATITAAGARCLGDALKGKAA